MIQIILKHKYNLAFQTKLLNWGGGMKQMSALEFIILLKHLKSFQFGSCIELQWVILYNCTWRDLNKQK